MSKKQKVSKYQQPEKKGVIYVSLYKGEPVSKLSEQIQSCLQIEGVKHQPAIEIYGDIEDPKISVGDISLSYPQYTLTIIEITPHNGKWSGFRLLATRENEDATS